MSCCRYYYGPQIKIRQYSVKCVNDATYLFHCVRLCAYTRDTFASTIIYTIETNVYSIKEDKIIWSGLTKTTKADGVKKIPEEVAEAVYKKMVKEGFISKWWNKQQQLIDNTYAGSNIDYTETQETYNTIKKYASKYPMVYLPSHDKDSGKRLLGKETVDAIL